MPIVRATNKLIFFAHVPKCAGRSVAAYLTLRFGAVAFLDRTFMQLPPDQRWSATSPQHIDAASLSRLFPPGFFDATFAVVRDPVDRLVSAFHFDVEGNYPSIRGRRFGVWLRHHLVRRGLRNPAARDNHLRPMHEMVPQDAQIFRLEDGLKAVESWLDRVTGTRWDGAGIEWTGARKDNPRATLPRAVPTDEDLALIATVYAADYERFGYEPRLPDPR